MSLMQYNNGGNAEPPTRSAIILTDTFYEATRSYINTESFGVEAPMYFLVMIFFLVTGSAVFYFCKIMW